MWGRLLPPTSVRTALVQGRGQCHSLLPPARGILTACPPPIASFVSDDDSLSTCRGRCGWGALWIPADLDVRLSYFSKSKVVRVVAACSDSGYPTSTATSATVIQNPGVGFVWLVMDAFAKRHEYCDSYGKTASNRK